jgi:hypothetical protein
MTMGAGSIWTPDGEVPLKEKDVLPLTRRQIIMLSELHEFAHYNGITIFCKRCEQPVTGQNNDSSQVLSVSCQCREWRFDGR